MEPGRRWARVARVTRPAVALALALVWLLAFAGHASIARADGGAPNLLYVAGAGTNGGDLVVADIARHQVTAHIISVDPSNAATAYVGFSYPLGLAVTTDADQSWRSIAH